MKKLIVISVLFVVFLNCYSQRIYTPDEYTAEAFENNVISLTLSPHKLGIGIMYISHPIFELINPISPLLAFEFGNYSFQNDIIKLLKLNLGISIIIRNFNFNLSPSVNVVKTNVKEQLFEPVTFEIGAMTKVEKTYVSISVDPILLEAKIGIGLGF